MNLVPSLGNLSLSCVAKNPCIHQHDFSRLPPNLKIQLAHILAKRSLLTEKNISSLIHSFTKELDLSNCDISGIGLEMIARSCKMLRKLDLNSAKQGRNTITDDGVANIARHCKMLQVLYMRRCLNIGDEAISEISAHCKWLKYLNLGACPLISDDSLKSLAMNCCMLESLNVSSTNISDDGVVSLCEGRCHCSLKELHIAHCCQITDESVKAVAWTCPNMGIFIFHGCPRITESSTFALEDMHSRRQKQMKHITWTIY